MVKNFHSLRWGLPFLAALLPIVLLSVYSFNTASRSVEDLVESSNLSATNDVGQLLTQDILRTVTIGHAIASVPSTLRAIKNQDDFAMRTSLQAIVLTYPQIDRAFITDKRGILWSNFPPVPGVFGSKQQDTEWYRGVSQHWKPYISGVYLSSRVAKSPVVAIAIPIQDGSGAVQGSLVLEYRTAQVNRWLQNIRLARTGFLYVVDQSGSIVAHPHVDSNDQISKQYADVLLIKRAQQGVFSTAQYRDPMSGKTMIASFQPISIGHNTWVIVAQQPVDEAYELLDRLKWRISIAGGLLTLLTLGMVVALAATSARNERLNRELAAKNQTLQDITSFVSHQLRAPVTAMRWTIESILDGDYGPLSDEMKGQIKNLDDVAVQNGNLINDILNISRIDRGVIEVKTEPVPLKDVAERALRDYRVALEKAGLSLTLVGMDLPITVMVDKEKMAESITNAISNAIKHTKKGGITVRLYKDAQFGYIDVTDTGEGMSQEIMDRLFSRTGVSGSNTNSSLSTGLGLYIARNFMQLQKGDITVSSEVGKGSTFTYGIPLL